MTTHVQPDLFGEYDAEQDAAAGWADLTAMPVPNCPACGTPPHSWERLDFSRDYYTPTTQPRTGCIHQTLIEHRIFHALTTGGWHEDLLQRARALGADVAGAIRRAETYLLEKETQ